MQGHNAHFLRYMTGKLVLIAFGVMGAHYYFKYQGNVSVVLLFFAESVT